MLVLIGAPVTIGLALTLAGAWDTGAWATVWQFPGLARSISVSVATGCAGAVIALALAHLIIAVAGVSRWMTPVRAIALPFIALPHLAVGIGLALLLAPSGLALRLLSPWATGLARPPDWLTVQDPLGIALTVGLIVKETPFLVLMLLAARAQVPVERLLVEGRILGYRSLKAWWVSVAPLLQRQIRMPFAAVLVFGITNVEMAIPLGPAMPPPFAVVLWQWFTASRLELRGAGFAGSVLLLLVTVAALAVVRVSSRAAHAAWRRHATSGGRGAEGGALRFLLAAIPALCVVAGVGAIVALLLRASSAAWRFPAVLPDDGDLPFVTDAAPALGHALATTTAIGVAVALLAVVFALAASELLRADPRRRHRFDVLFFVPLLVPQIAFLYGFQWLLVRMRLDGSLLAVIWEHVVFALPYAWGLVSGARDAVDPRFVTVARSLGSGPGRAWRAVVLPLLLRAVLVAAAIAFAVSAALYLPTLFAGAGRVVTVATEAASAAASGNLRVAAAYGAAQAVAPLMMLATCTYAARAVYRHRRGVPS